MLRFGRLVHCANNGTAAIASSAVKLNVARRTCLLRADTESDGY